MFSESGLRQRLVDIRLSLHNWKKNNIFLKENLRDSKSLELDICTFLKNNAGEELFYKFVEELQKRNKTHFILRTLAKCFYQITDDKYLTYDKVKAAVIQRISEKS